jgi:hypothetical protein
MCSHAEWEKLRRMVEDAVDSEDLRDFLSEAAVRVEALLDEIKDRTCATENTEWVHRRQQRSRAQWVV